jgi:sec-independent protein translocase protein TatA
MVGSATGLRPPTGTSGSPGRAGPFWWRQVGVNCRLGKATGIRDHIGNEHHRTCTAPKERRGAQSPRKVSSMNFTLPSEIFGMDGLIVLIVVALVLFGSTQVPKLARSLGSAQTEFKKGVANGASDVPGVAPAVVSPAGTVPSDGER